MITVKYAREAFTMTVKGHARSGKPGEDLVCSAASILVHTAADVVSSMQSDNLCTDAIIQLEKGDAFMVCKPAEGYADCLMTALDTVATGFRILAHHYPEYVTFEIQ